MQGHELMTEIGHDLPGQAGQILFGAFQTLLGEGDSVTGTLSNNDPKLGQNASEHVHDLRPLSDDQVPHTV